MDALAKVELLKDSVGDRVVKSVDLPPNKPISAKLLYPYSGNPLQLKKNRGRCQQARLEACEAIFNKRRNYRKGFGSQND
jgi:hypothetical protein